jgi:hypothetical protein
VSFVEVLDDKGVAAEPGACKLWPNAGGKLAVDSKQSAVVVSFAAGTEILLRLRVTARIKRLDGAIAVDECLLRGVADGVEISGEHPLVAGLRRRHELLDLDPFKWPVSRPPNGEPGIWVQPGGTAVRVSVERLPDYGQWIEVILTERAAVPIVSLKELFVLVLVADAAFVEREPGNEFVLLGKSKDGPNELVVDAGSVAASQELVVMEGVLSCVETPGAGVKTGDRDEATLVEEWDQIWRGCKDARVGGRVVEEFDGQGRSK